MDMADFKALRKNLAKPWAALEFVVLGVRGYWTAQAITNARPVLRSSMTVEPDKLHLGNQPLQ